MDRNSAIGLTLIAALLLAYFYWFAPQPQPPAPETATQTQQPEKKSGVLQQPPVADDSVRIASYGDLSMFVTGSETPATIETQDLKITFSNKGGVIQKVELKKYKTYSQKPLSLITSERTKFNLKAIYKGKEVDLYSLY
jgi:YidC/Oxa1 family membrane protein insertase